MKINSWNLVSETRNQFLRTSSGLRRIGEILDESLSARCAQTTELDRINLRDEELSVGDLMDCRHDLFVTRWIARDRNGNVYTGWNSIDGLLWSPKEECEGSEQTFDSQAEAERWLSENKIEEGSAATIVTEHE